MYYNHIPYIEIIDKNSEGLLHLIEKYKVAKLYLFGSFAKGSFQNTSDIDFIVYFLPDIEIEDYADNFFELISEMENLFKRKVDMISGKAMKNPYFIEEVDKTKVLIYDYNNQKIAVWYSDLYTINTYSFGGKANFYEYQNNLTVKRAIERELEIIGEAVKRILNEQPDFQLSNARRIVDLRNYIIHGYDAIDDETIWGIVNKHVPLLEHEISQIMKAF